MNAFTELPPTVRDTVMAAEVAHLAQVFPDQDATTLADLRLVQFGYLKEDLPGMLVDLMALCWRQGREAGANDTNPYVTLGDLYDVALEATDSVLGAGTYASVNASNPDPGVQGAISRSTTH